MMSDKERIALLERENADLKEQTEALFMTIRAVYHSRNLSYIRAMCYGALHTFTHMYREAEVSEF